MDTNQRHNHHLQQKGNRTKIFIRGKIARKLPLNPKTMQKFHSLTILTCLNWQDALETILQTANTSAHLHHLFSVVHLSATVEKDAFRGAFFSICQFAGLVQWWWLPCATV